MITGYNTDVRRVGVAFHVQTEELVRRRPGESVAIVFGVGLVAGVLVSTLLRR